MSAISEAEKGWNGVVREPQRYYGENRLGFLTTGTYRRARHGPQTSNYNVCATHQSQIPRCAWNDTAPERFSATC